MNSKPSSARDDGELPEEPLALQNLKRVWGISNKKREQEPAPTNVCTNIYSVPPSKRPPIPSRRRPT